MWCIVSMDMDDNWQNLTKKERRLLARQQRAEEQISVQRQGKIWKWLVVVLVVGLVGAGGWWLSTRPGVSNEEIISRKGLHWHPELTIIIKGEKQEISANIGIGAAHQPIHTHDVTGTLHLEIQGLVTKDDIKIGRFFKIWGKQFSSSCILDFCNSEEEKVKMFVNGQGNGEFENYLMKDKDKIEIRYE